MPKAETNIPFEIVLKRKIAREDPFDETEVDVVFVCPDGTEVPMPAFRRKDGAYVCRFAPPAPGEYRWESVASDTDDDGLHGRSGTFEAVAYDGPCVLYRTGRVCVEGSRRALVHWDGTPFFWLADTWWFGLTSRVRPEDLKRLVRDRLAKGFTAVQLVAGPMPDVDPRTDQWNAAQANGGGLPWEADWARVNAAWYDDADKRIEYLVEQGLVPVVTGMWGFFLPVMGVERVKRHWRNLVARYAAWPVVFCLAGESSMAAYSLADDASARDADRETQRAGWREIAEYVRGLDPYGTLLCLHPPGVGGGRDEIDGAGEILDLDMLQTSHLGHRAFEPTVRCVTDARRREPPMPVVVGEASYEGIMGSSLPDAQRYLFWASVTSGACGFTYGAQGLWAMSRADDPHDGATGSWGEGFWDRAMHYLGSTHVGIGAMTLARLPWWLLAPRDEPAAVEAGRINALALGLDGTLALFYLPAAVDDALLGMRRDAWSLATLPIRIEDGASYAARFIDPRTGEETDAGPVVPDADGTWVCETVPSRSDWALLLEDAPAMERLASAASDEIRQ